MFLYTYFFIRVYTFPRIEAWVKRPMCIPLVRISLGSRRSCPGLVFAAPGTRRGGFSGEAAAKPDRTASRPLPRHPGSRAGGSKAGRVGEGEEEESRAPARRIGSRRLLPTRSKGKPAEKGPSVVVRATAQDTRDQQQIAEVTRGRQRHLRPDYTPIARRETDDGPHEILPVCGRGSINRSNPDGKADSRTICTRRVDGSCHMDNPGKGHISTDRTQGVSLGRVDQKCVLALPVISRDVSRKVAGIPKDLRSRQGPRPQPRCGRYSIMPCSLPCRDDLRINKSRIYCHLAPALSCIVLPGRCL